MLDEGARIDPLNGQIRLQLQVATQGVLRDLVEGAAGLLRFAWHACVAHVRITLQDCTLV